MSDEAPPADAPAVNYPVVAADGSPSGFAALVRSRRMVRRFSDQPVASELVDRIVGLGLRAPSAGFSQGWDFVVLDDPAAHERFWNATSDRAAEPDRWLRGVSSAPVLILCCSDKQTYLRRYAEPDKPWQDGSADHWPTPYWDVDTGMAVMIMLLAATEAGLGSLFFGVPGERIPAVLDAFGIPSDRRIIGVIALGRPAESTPSGSTRARRRRPLSEVMHRNRFGPSAADRDQ